VLYSFLGLVADVRRDVSRSGEPARDRERWEEPSGIDQHQVVKGVGWETPSGPDQLPTGEFDEESMEG
jgi:hypothetical protein